jgi:hypothetical protein
MKIIKELREIAEMVDIDHDICDVCAKAADEIEYLKGQIEQLEMEQAGEDW